MPHNLNEPIGANSIGSSKITKPRVDTIDIAKNPEDMYNATGLVGHGPFVYKSVYEKRTPTQNQVHQQLMQIEPNFVQKQKRQLSKFELI